MFGYGLTGGLLPDICDCDFASAAMAFNAATASSIVLKGNGQMMIVGPTNNICSNVVCCQRSRLFSCEADGLERAMHVTGDRST